MSIVIPVYGCGAVLPALVADIAASMQSMACTDYEIILIEDGSPDGAWNTIEILAASNSRVFGFKLSRNFGQHAAIQAGLSQARKEWVVVMDCDMQDKPSEIPKLYTKAMEGFDLVLAQRVERNDSSMKQSSSKLFYTILSYLTETDIDPSVANFGIYHQRVIKSILAMGDYVRFFPSMAAWVGFNRASVQIEHGSRDQGKSSYSWSSLMRLGLNVIISFSDKPLRLVVKFGFIITLIVIVAAAVTVFQFFTGNIEVLGYTSLILSLWFLGGLIISLLGIIGLYLGKAFDQVKQRPIFIISKTTNDEA